MKMWFTGNFCIGIAAALQCAAVAGSLRIVPIAPVPGGHVSAQRPTIEFEIHTGGNAGVTRDQVHVTLDGDDASRDLQIVGSRLEIVPHDRLALGAHQVDVSVEDRSGERAVDHWTFTADAQDAAVPTVQDDTSPNDSSGYGNGSDGAYAGGSLYGGSGYNGYGYGGYGSPYGYYPGSGFFFPANYGPYYVGEPLVFIYNGFGLGGFVTIGGFPGSYPLVPFAPNYYFVTVPVPSSYNGGTPIAACHFPSRRRLLASGPVKIENAHRPAESRRPVWSAPHWRPTLASLALLPGTPDTLRRSITEHRSIEPQSHLGTIGRFGEAAEPRIVPSAPRIVPAHRTFGNVPIAPHFAPAFAPRFAPLAESHAAVPPVTRH